MFMRKNGAGYVMVAPMVVGILVFVVYPMIKALLYSFERTNGIVAKWVGIKNYVWIFNDAVFWKSVYNTFYMAVLSVVFSITVCFVLASLINSLSSGKNLFKGLYFLPNVVSVVAGAILFKYLFYPTDEGIVNFLLSKVGIQSVGWFTSPTIAPLSIVIMSIWRSMGYDTILFLAGLQSVPREHYEAASVDGAGSLRQWWYITIPSMKPIFVFVIIMATINSLKRFSDVYMIGGIGGNPGGSIQTIVLYIYRNAWQTSQVGIASAAGYMLFLFSLVFTIINFKLLGVGKEN
jgi:multiple sugar transport system permease protein